MKPTDPRELLRLSQTILKKPVYTACPSCGGIVKNNIGEKNDMTAAKLCTGCAKEALIEGSKASDILSQYDDPIAGFVALEKELGVSDKEINEGLSQIKRI